MPSDAPVCMFCWILRGVVESVDPFLHSVGFQGKKKFAGCNVAVAKSPVQAKHRNESDLGHSCPLCTLWRGCKGQDGRKDETCH